MLSLSFRKSLSKSPSIILSTSTKSHIPPEEASDCMNLLKIWWSSNTCLVRKEFSTFPDDIGIPIGSPLGSLISEIFMHKFEHDLFHPPLPLTPYISYWHRYVDDILCLWSGTIQDLQAFLDLLNSQYLSVQFTMEIGGKEISFFDLYKPYTMGS